MSKKNKEVQVDINVDVTEKLSKVVTELIEKNENLYTEIADLKNRIEVLESQGGF